MAMVVSIKVKICKLFSIKRLSYVIIFATILNLSNQIIIYTPTQFAEWLTIETCKHTALFGTLCALVCKLALHLFVAIRAQINQDSINAVYLKIGFGLILSDIALMFCIVSGLAPMNVTISRSVNGSVMCVANGALFTYVWYAINDFVIGIYCLLAFILPLISYIKLETALTSEEVSTPAKFSAVNVSNVTLRSVALKIIIYSSIALISTMIITIFCSVITQATGIAMTFDLVLNCICVILQFGNIDCRLVPAWFRWIACVLQCGNGISNESVVITNSPSKMSSPKPQRIRARVHTRSDSALSAIPKPICVDVTSVSTVGKPAKIEIITPKKSPISVGHLAVNTPANIRVQILNQRLPTHTPVLSGTGTTHSTPHSTYSQYSPFESAETHSEKMEQHTYID